MSAVPEKIASIRLLTGFRNETGIEGDDPLTLGPDRFIDQLPVERNRIKRFGKLTRVGLLRKVAVAAQIAEMDLATDDQNRRNSVKRNFLGGLEILTPLSIFFARSMSAVSPDEGYR